MEWTETKYAQLFGSTCTCHVPNIRGWGTDEICNHLKEFFPQFQFSEPQAEKLRC